MQRADEGLTYLLPNLVNHPVARVAGLSDLVMIGGSGF
jgi:hypothetical protein